MKPLNILLILSLGFAVGCRSEADHMAEFCIKYDAEVKASTDCQDMAARLKDLLSPPQHHFRDTDICSETKACAPCRNAAREMLKRCGYEPEIKPILDQMHFSDTLRKQMLSEED